MNIAPEEMPREIARLEDENELLQNRIEKTIEYIENPRHEMSVKSYQELLEILKGGE